MSGAELSKALLAETRPLRLKLPATSANLGPGFDTLALALTLYLEIEAAPALGERRAGGIADATSGGFSIQAAGRDSAICSRVEDNLLLKVYRETVARHSARPAMPLALAMRNGIPLGMGCGSSAASRLAGVALASHFGSLGWSRERILAEAALLEGHPDNAAACSMGGFVASGWLAPALAPAGPPSLAAVSLPAPSHWHALLVLPELALATSQSRAVLPEQYRRRDVVLNLQRVALLTAAFATGRADLLAAASGDSLHQPYRLEVCPLLGSLLPLAGQAGILSVTLSGAGPAALLLLESARAEQEASLLVRRQAERDGLVISELIGCSICSEGAEVLIGDPVSDQQSGERLH